jgi:hypothetical protein
MLHDVQDARFARHLGHRVVDSVHRSTKASRRCETPIVHLRTHKITGKGWSRSSPPPGDFVSPGHVMGKLREHPANN